MSETQIQAQMDEEGLCDLARRLVLAEGERAKAQAEGAAAEERTRQAHDKTRQAREALEGLLRDFRAIMPQGEDLGAGLDRLRAARAEEVRLSEAETEARVAWLEARRRALHARQREIALVDGLQQQPLIDYALANRAEAEAPPAAEKADAPFHHAEPVTLTPEGAAVVGAASDPAIPDAPGKAKGRRRKEAKS